MRISEPGTETVVSPFDTTISAATRFGIEVAAWVLGPWAAAEMTGTVWTAVPVLVVLVGLPALFNTPGDKNFVGIPTPGSLRVAIEMLLLIVAIGASWVVLPRWVTALVVILGAAMIASGIKRYRWLLQSPGRS